jgi:hypothetical protein
MFVRPRAMPKMDYSKGIPAESKTLVVVPTLLMNREQMERAVCDLEIRFLGNRDANLHFALLTDPPDAPTQFDKRDELGPECAKRIEELNQRYAEQGRGSFFLFHRNRTFNAVEKIWMGWERKRGKLLDLNNLLVGKSNNFSVIAGDQKLLDGFKYVITLDADTQLPRDAAHRLVGAIAHPLQRAVVHPVSNVVVEGYGILQPRVGVSIHSANRSRLASLFSGDSTFDVYTRAVSDVYQDLFGEGSFTGKGIYEIEVFPAGAGAAFSVERDPEPRHDRRRLRACRAAFRRRSDRRLPVAHRGLQQAEAPLGARRLADPVLAVPACAGLFRQRGAQPDQPDFALENSR